MKTTMIAAAAVALVVGIAAVGGTSVAGPIKLKPGCWPGFSGSFYLGCQKVFRAPCPAGWHRNGPTLVEIKKNTFRVRYTCTKT